MTKTPFRYGYNTNGFSHHRLEDALKILAELGYEAVALTLDVHHLDPLRAAPSEVADMRLLIEDLGLEVAIETGARFLLDPRRKHQPTLLDPAPHERRARLDHLARCVEIGAELGARVLSFWSGAQPREVSRARAWEFLCEGITELLARADGCGVALCLEPEPGMLVETLEQYGRLRGELSRGPLHLALDVGHLYCSESESPLALIADWGPRIAQFTIEDMKRGVHDHLFFGEGDVDSAAILEAVRETPYRGPIYVELGRHSHDAVETARRALHYLRGVTGAQAPE